MEQITDFNEFAFLTIEENLKIAEYAMSKPKSPDSDSCYGMSAFVLMSSVIDIIGTFYRKGHFEYITSEAVKETDKLGTCKDHFKYFFKNSDGVVTIYLKQLFSVVSHSYEMMKKEIKDVTSPVFQGPTTGITTN